MKEKKKGGNSHGECLPRNHPSPASPQHRESGLLTLIGRDIQSQHPQNK